MLEALAKMAEKDVGSLVVTDCEKFVGIITGRHIPVTAPIAAATVSTPVVRVPEAARNRF